MDRGPNLIKGAPLGAEMGPQKLGRGPDFGGWGPQYDKKSLLGAEMGPPKIKKGP